jgi:tetratricopeptide (TPR) repeat protein
VRQVIGRRLSRLPDVANKLLTAASGFNGPFRLDIAAAAAGINEDAALDAIDAALESQLVRASSNTEIFEFTHALIRHTLYGELSPPRQVRLHRQIAEAMERVYGDRAADHAPELAYQFHRSAGLPGTERGADYALAAAATAEATAAWDETVSFLEMALELLSEGDPRRGRVYGRLAIAQAWALRPDNAEHNAAEAAGLIAKTENRDAAADFLAEAQSALGGSGHTQAQWRIGGLGLQYISADRRDLTWARLAAADMRRAESEDPDNPGITLPSPLNTEIWNTLMSSEDPLAREIRYSMPLVPGYTTRAEAQVYLDAERAWLRNRQVDEAASSVYEGIPMGDAMLGGFTTGDLRDARSAWVKLTEVNERRGALGAAISTGATVARLHYALGDIEQGDAELERTRSRSARFDVAGPFTLQLVAAEDERRLVTGDWSGTQEFIASLGGQQVVENRWAGAAIVSGLARAFASLGQHDTAIALLPQVLEPIERAPGMAVNYPRMTSTAAEALWITQRTDHIDIIEKALREKVVGPDICYPNVDGRLDLARLCALKGDYAEASDWFAKARTVLDEQGARPLRAITDYDEALMYARRNAAGDRERALPLVDAATQQFTEIGMPGWTRKAQELRTTLTA